MTYPTRRAMSLALALSGASMLAHNLFELPLSPLDVENSGPLVVDVILAAAFALRPRSFAAIVSIAAWGLLNLVIGGIITVLPLPILPFAPEQTVSHYLAHAVYMLGQVPLVVLSTRAIRSAALTRPQHS
ncbi:MAG: hypothetical protein FIA92_07800 [Chloroflexi bacterium]|nr:hypothetical protein [Chloroflexota bacterium]